MPLTLGRSFTDKVVMGHISNAGNSSGANAIIVVPFRGRVMELGFTPHSAVTSAITLQVTQYTAAGSQAVSSAVVVTSGLGTFASQYTLEGMTCSLNNGQYAAINVVQGDTLKFTTSGGQAAALPATIYAVIRADK